MKTINYIFLALVLAFTASCIEPEDKVTSNAIEAGVVIDNANASGAILGLPNPDSTVSFLEVGVNYTIETFSGDPSSIPTYKVVKSFNGEAGSETVEIGTFNEVPYSIELNGIQEVLEGFEVRENELRIGDLVTFSTYLVTSSGEEYKVNPNDGDLALTVNCLSDLAGMYTVEASSPDTGTELTYEGEIVETAPGEYYFLPSSAYVVSLGYTGANAIPTVFTDVCGALTIPAQNLGGNVDGFPQFSNDVSGEGSIDPETGVITFEYTISGLGPQIDVFTPVE